MIHWKVRAFHFHVFLIVLQSQNSKTNFCEKKKNAKICIRMDGCKYDKMGFNKVYHYFNANLYEVNFTSNATQL